MASILMPELALVNIAEINVEGRFRKEYGDMKGLSDSFDAVGLIHPLAVKRLENDPNFKYQLLAGGRRYFALLERKVFNINVSIFPHDLDEEQMLVIEQTENLQRLDMDWKERVALETAIHNFHAANNPNWGQRDTAKTISRNQASISQSQKLAAAIEKYPEVKDAKNVATALSMLKKIENEHTAAKIAEQRKKALETCPEKKKPFMRLLDHYNVKDAFDGMAELKDGHFDMIEIDPPYGIDYTQFVRDKADCRHYQEVEKSDYAAFADRLLSEAWRLTKPNGWCLLWCGFQHLNMLENLMRKVGFKVPNVPMIWNKVAGGAVNIEYNLVSTAEVCIYGRKGTPKLTKMGTGNIFTGLSPRNHSRIHPTERPLSLMKDIFGAFLPPGSTILSPFLGSGVSIVAADRCFMHCMGFDLSHEHKNFFALKVQDWENFKNSDIGKEDDA